MTSLYVKRAQDMALRLLSEEYGVAGSTEAAMRCVSRKYGIPFSALWALRYRAPKDVFASVYFELQAAYEATVAAHDKQYQHELQMREAAGRADAPLVRAARAIGGQSDG